MEAFSLRKYWPRNITTTTTTSTTSGSGGPLPTLLLLDAGGAADATNSSTHLLLEVDATANATSTLFQSHDDQDGGPFFDLEFAAHEMNNKQTHTSTQQLQDQVHQNNNIIQEVEQECDSDDSDVVVDKLDGDFEFALSSDHHFFKGTLVSTTTTTTNNAHAAKSHQFLFKSATKFRILMLKFKKKSKTIANQQPQKQECLNHRPAPAREFLTVKSKEQIGPEVPSPSSSSSDSALSSSSSSSSDEKRFSKDLMQRYLNKVKPLYVRASRDKPNSPPPGQQLNLVGSSPNTPAPVNAKAQKQGNLQAGLRVVHKHLGKSRSASSATPCGPPVTSQRRDDSLLEQQDGIQGAILHCKRSFNASR